MLSNYKLPVPVLVPKPMVGLKADANLDNEEIMVMCSVEELKKHFYQETLIVWHDPNINSNQNIAYVKELKAIFNNIKTFNHYQDALFYLSTNNLPCQVITSGTDGEKLVSNLHNMATEKSKCIKYIHVFCNNIEFHGKWASRLPKVVSVKNNFKDLLGQVISMERNISSRNDLPSYSPIFNDFNKSENRYLHLYLKGFVNFQSWEQSKRDFLSLTRGIYGQDKCIDEFEKTYKEYDMKNIFRWYTKECFFYKLINNCLRIASSDSILYSRLVIRDLEKAIKEQYQKESKKFSGLVYRGAYISNEEWTQLQANIGKEIEMFGFLSTSKDMNVALKYNQDDLKNKALITIIVPGAPDKGEQGFAEIKEYSIYKQEDEVLFNIRSRFTVLEVSNLMKNGIIYRHLVLLYGAQAMRKFIRTEKPLLNINLKLDQNIKCRRCQAGMLGNSIMLKNLCQDNQYICRRCLNGIGCPNISVFLCISPTKKDLELQIEGITMQYQKKPEIGFYGYGECAQCKKKDYKVCYRCLSCSRKKVIFCDECFNQNNDCCTKGHAVILEASPYSLWLEKMSDEESSSLEYYEKKFNNISKIFHQAEIFYETHQYDKAIQYYERYLDSKRADKDLTNKAEALSRQGMAYQALGQNERAIQSHQNALKIRENIFGFDTILTATSHNNLGGVYQNLRDYHKAKEHYLKALEIQIKVLGNGHLDTAISYNNVGSVYDDLGDHQEAIENHQKALDIKKKVLGENHPNTAISYSNIGRVHFKLKEYEKAIKNYELGLKIYKEVFGDKHPDTAISYHNLGSAFLAKDDKVQAIKHYELALDIKRRLFGEVNLETARSYTDLGYAHEVNKNYEKAVNLYKSALDILGKVSVQENLKEKLEKDLALLEEKLISH